MESESWLHEISIHIVGARKTTRDEHDTRRDTTKKTTETNTTKTKTKTTITSTTTTSTIMTTTATTTTITTTASTTGSPQGWVWGEALHKTSALRIG